MAWTSGPWLVPGIVVMTETTPAGVMQGNPPVLARGTARVGVPHGRKHTVVRRPAKIVVAPFAWFTGYCTV